MLVSARWIVGALAALCSVDATMNYEYVWIRGEKGQNCQTVCEALSPKRYCVGGHWPKNVRDMLHVDNSSGTVGRSECKDVERIAAPSSSLAKPAPYYDGRSGTCTYNPEVQYIECDQDPVAEYQRYCPCSSKPPRWLLADANKSCTDFCRGRGGQCASDPGIWPDSWEEVRDIAQPLGMSCNDASRNDVAHKLDGPPAPSIKGDECFWLNDAGEGACDNPADPSLATFHRRICPCIGASLTPLTLSGGSSNPGAIHADKIGAEGACRGGGFKIGKAISTSTKHVAGGLLANNNEECRQRVVQYCPDPDGLLNGATYKHDTKECFCEYGMSGYDTTTGFNNCWFTDETITQGAGDLISKYRRFTADMSAPSAAAAASACALAAVVGAALVVSLRGMRRPAAFLRAETGEDQNAQTE